jgi:hypothetical protein
MNGRFTFLPGKREIAELLTLHALGKHVLIVGAAGIGKTALLREISHHCTLLISEETASLGRICDSLERQLGWAPHNLKLIERKNRLLDYLIRRGEPVVFDNLSQTAPRVAHFIAHLGEKIPIWIACRSDQRQEIGHIWPELYKFSRVEMSPLTQLETRALVAEAVAQGNIQEDAREHVSELHEMSEGNPRILHQLLIKLAERKYEIGSSFGLNLLNLDRRIHEVVASASLPMKRGGGLQADAGTP